MNPTLKTLVMKRFRSIPSERVTFDNPTIFVGRNGAGKSNLISAFAFLADAMSTPLQAVVDKAGGLGAVRHRGAGKSYPPNLGLRVELEGANGAAWSGFYAFELKPLGSSPFVFSVLREQCRVTSESRSYFFDRGENGFRSNLPGIRPAVDPASLALPLVGGEKSFAPILRTLAGFRVYSIEPARLRELQEPDAGTSLRSDGGNVTSVLREIERQSAGDFARISEFLASIVPHTSRVEVKKHGKSLGLEVAQDWPEKRRLRFEGPSLSDGTLRAIGLITAVFQRPVPSLVAIEEPEATIHPGALESILDLLDLAARRTQVVLTTHSPELLEAKWIAGRHLRIVENHAGATRVGAVSEETRTVLQSHLMGAGELLRSNALESTMHGDEPEKLDSSSLFEEFPEAQE